MTFFRGNVKEPANRSHNLIRSRVRTSRGKRSRFRTKTRRQSHHLFECWPQIVRRLRASKCLALFLDFDGTLVTLRGRPGDARLGKAERHLLRRLALLPQVTLCIISGRRRADLRRRVRVPGARYLGLYGWEQEDGRLSPGSVRKLLQKARQQIEERIRGLGGIWIEDKKFAFVVHYREARNDAVRRARAIVGEVLEGLRSGLQQLRGKRALEVLPREAEGKGVAARRVLDELPRPVLAVYVGDDLADESAFATLRRGITVHVGPSRDTQARFFLREPAEVMSFLEKLEREIV